MISRIKDFPFQFISNFKSIPVDNALLLFCDPRGGSTWLAETLNTIPRSLIIDEPLHLNNTKALQDLNFSWRQYIPEQEAWPEAKSIFNKILRGKLLNNGLCYRNSPLEAAMANQLILKIIRGKALLPWLIKQFNFSYKPLVLVRNPFALIASQLKHGAWDYSFEKFQLPQSPFNEFFKTHLTFLSSLTSKEEQLTALWCMTNNVVLKHAENNSSWISFNYENLVLEPEKHFKQLFLAWGIKPPPQLWDSINQPSSTTVGKKSIEAAALVSAWKKVLTLKQIEKIKEVLQYFEIDYYSEEVLPLIPADKVHLSN